MNPFWSDRNRNHPLRWVYRILILLALSVPPTIVLGLWVEAWRR